ncbi:hypothetical protein D1007_52019 [Hordeum vulgare]|nr:hypothetical protein D1007_52019 [Hordeum vulgare]
MWLLPQALGLLEQLGIEGFKILVDPLNHVELALSGGNLRNPLQHLSYNTSISRTRRRVCGLGLNTAMVAIFGPNHLPQALHHQLSKILLMSVFAFYCESFVGVRPLVALFRHFISLRLHEGVHLLACVSFVSAQSGNLLLKVGQKVENFTHRWVLMSFKDANPRLEEPKGLLENTTVWISSKLSDPRAAPNMECFSHDISAKRLTGGMIVKEFLAQRLVPLQAHSVPLWDYQTGDDKLRLRSQDLPTEELNRVLATLLGGDPGDLPEALVPLYCLNDRADLIAALPIFDERGLLPVEGSSPIEVSLDDTSSREDMEKTIDDCPDLHGIRIGPAHHAVREHARLPEARSAGGNSEALSLLPSVGGPTDPTVTEVDRKRRWVDVKDYVNCLVKPRASIVRAWLIPFLLDVQGCYLAGGEEEEGGCQAERDS